MENTKSTVYISNLNYKSDRNGLRSMFMPFGNVKSIKIIVEPETNQSRGMAFVEMGSPEEAKKAIAALDGRVISGRTVKAKQATQPPTPPRSLNRTRSEAVDAKKKDENRDLEFEGIQKAKAVRNASKRGANPIVMKYVPAKKTAK